jgi:hypothetical protein
VGATVGVTAGAVGEAVAVVAVGATAGAVGEAVAVVAVGATAAAVGEAVAAGPWADGATTGDSAVSLRVDGAASGLADATSRDGAESTEGTLLSGGALLCGG